MKVAAQIVAVILIGFLLGTGFELGRTMIQGTSEQCP